MSRRCDREGVEWPRLLMIHEDLNRALRLRPYPWEATAYDWRKTLASYADDVIGARGPYGVRSAIVRGRVLEHLRSLAPERLP